MKYDIRNDSVLSAKEFLLCFNNPCYCCIDTSKRGKAIHYFNDFEDIEDELRTMNKPVHKMDVFFTPNGQYKEKESRSVAKGDSFDYIVLDFDNCKTEKEKKEILCDIEFLEDFLEIKSATFILETGNGIHLYYRLSESIDTTDASDYKSLVKFLLNGINKKKGDYGCTDISRLFRVPTFKYWKDNRGEFEIRVLYANQASTISLKDTHSLATKVEELKKNEQKKQKHFEDISRKYSRKSSKEYNEGYYSTVNAIPITDVLTSLGYQYKGINIIDGDTGEISDGWRINKGDNYVNNFTESKPHRPMGPPFSFVFRECNNDFQRAMEFFSKNFKIDMPQISYKLASDDIENKDEREALIVDGESFMGENKNITKFIDTERGNLIIVDKEKKGIFAENDKGMIIKVSNFYIEPIATTVNDDGTSSGGILVNVIGQYGESGAIYLPKDMSPSVFTKELRNHGMFTFMAGARTLAILMEHVFEQLKKRRIYENRMIGFNKRGNFIAGNFIYDAKKSKVNRLDEGTVIHGDEYISIGNGKGKVGAEDIKNMSFDIPKDTERLREELSPTKMKTTICAQIKKFGIVYDKKVSYPLALSSLLGYITPLLRRHRIPVPYCFLFGITQSGKSTISDIIKDKMIGDMGEKLSAMTTTILPFQQAMGQGKTVFVGEFRVEDTGARSRLYNMIRDLYDGTTTKRGKSDLSVDNYDMISTLIIDGEHVIDDPATFSRGIFLHCRASLKGDISKAAEIKNIILHFIKIVSEKMDGDEYLFMKEYKEKLDSYEQIITERMADVACGESSRVIRNFSHLFIIADIIGFDFDYIYESIETSVRTQLVRVNQKSAGKIMLWKLGGYIKEVSDNDAEFISTSVMPDGAMLIQIDIFLIKSFLEINKKIRSTELDNIIESFHGEDGIHMIANKMYVDASIITEDLTFSQAIAHALKRKADLGAGPNGWTSHDTKVRNYICDELAKKEKDAFKSLTILRNEDRS